MMDEEFGYKAGFRYGEFADADRSAGHFAGFKTEDESLDHWVAELESAPDAERGNDGVILSAATMSARSGFCRGFRDARQGIDFPQGLHDYGQSLRNV